MLEFDDDVAANRLMKDYSDYPRNVALTAVRARHDLHEKLHPAFLIWLSGEVPKFEYEGFTLDSIKELVKTESYFIAIVRMDMI